MLTPTCRPNNAPPLIVMPTKTVSLRKKRQRMTIFYELEAFKVDIRWILARRECACAGNDDLSGEMRCSPPSCDMARRGRAFSSALTTEH